MLARVTIALAACLALDAAAEQIAPRHVSTIVLGPFTGHDAPLHPANESPERIVYYGTDLGWAYEHNGKMQFLFGDTLKISGEPIHPTHDDAFGTIDLAQWPDGRNIGVGRVPPLLLVRSKGAQLATFDPGHPMEGLKTPVAGFSNGAQEFALFITGKPQACRVDTDCGSGLVCDTELGYVGEPPQQERGLTFACARDWPGCRMGTLPQQKGSGAKSGFCSDRSSTLWSQSDYGRVSSVAWKQIFGVRAAPDSGQYTNTRTWFTNKFINVASRTVTRFSDAGPANDYRRPEGMAESAAVLLWGRPHFIGVNSKGATLGMYFAYAQMPVAPAFEWKVRYFAGMHEGKARFSDDERDAVAVDLDSLAPGVQPVEVHDIVQHMSVVWIDELKKWVMLYGGGVSKVPVPIAPTCGVLEVFARNECANVVIGNGAIRMRTADQPWGPWTPPEDVFVAGDPNARPVTDQYASGGVLHHPACRGPKCQSPSAHLPKDDYGWLYGANIIEQWTRPTDDGVEIIWNASTWDPYRVILLKTRIAR